MLKMVLADDEPLILKGLKKIIPWSEYGIEIVGEATNGDQAEEILLAEKPDIFISDICMPGRNGIELLQMLHDHNMNTKVILLSGYQEFAYAKEAIAFGALEYILKPIDKEQLNEAIHKACSLIRKEREEIRLREKLTRYEMERTDTIRENAWERLIAGTISPRELKVLAPDIGGGFYTVVNIIIDELFDNPRAFSAQEIQLIQYSVCNLIQKMLDERKAGHALIKGQQITLVLCYHEKQPAPTEAQDFAAEVGRMVKSQKKKTVTIGVGEMVSGWESVPRSYQSALRALEVRFFTGNDRIIVSTEEHLPKYQLEDLYFEQKKLFNGVLTNESELIDESLANMKYIISDIAWGDKETAVGYYLTVLANLGRELTGYGIELEDLAGQMSCITKELKPSATLNELHSRLTRYLDGLTERIAFQIKSSETQVIKEVKEYIEAHYNQDITLETAAGIACMNPNYFSVFFKNHTGENFRDFLLRIRMEKALGILLSSECKTYEIADRVGFNDPKHFSEMFKKYYGKNPMEYKKDFLKKPTLF